VGFAAISSVSFSNFFQTPTSKLSKPSNAKINFNIVSRSLEQSLGTPNILGRLAISSDPLLDGALNLPDPSTLPTWTTSGADLATFRWALFTFTVTLLNNIFALSNLPELQSANSIPELWQLKIVQKGGDGSVNLRSSRP
jgi:hypothetical protein